jgi:HlyD family secretion protein
LKLKTKIIIAAITLVVVTAIAWLIFKKENGDKTTYTYVDVTKGDIENTVDATGTIEPVTTVQVGTQVSGIINNIYVDFNDKVVKNQLMAVIDTTILSVQVRDARANLLRSQSEFDQAKYNFERTEKLYNEKLLSELEFINAKSNYQSAQSSLLSSKNNLERAERNMRYAFIRSPINGTVIYRAVEEGQTVASNFQTPELFLIAEDLSKMEIHALVDESEIGSIKVGQAVRFEVQAFDNKTFHGAVRQVWLQPETVQNVVNYTAVIDAENPDGLLLPGMTANIDFIVEQKKDVLLVPIAAAKLEPTEKMMKIMFANMQKRFGGNKNSQGGQPPAGGFGGSMPGAGFGSSTMKPPTDFAMLWFFDKKKELQSAPVRTGATDGKNIEITPMFGAPIEVGMKVIGSIETTSANSNSTAPRSPFGRRPF